MIFDQSQSPYKVNMGTYTSSFKNHDLKQTKNENNIISKNITNILNIDIKLDAQRHNIQKTQIQIKKSILNSDRILKLKNENVIFNQTSKYGLLQRKLDPLPLQRQKKTSPFSSPRASHTSMTDITNENENFEPRPRLFQDENLIGQNESKGFPQTLVKNFR